MTVYSFINEGTQQYKATIDKLFLDKKFKFIYLNYISIFCICIYLKDYLYLLQIEDYLYLLEIKIEYYLNLLEKID